MATHLYPKAFKAAFTGGANVNLLTVAVKAVLVDTGTYTYDAAHEFLSDIPAGARLAISPALSGKVVSDLAVFDSDNTSFTAPPPTSAEGIVLFVDTGVPGTSRLIWYQDSGITGLPVTPAGANYNLTVDAAGWFVGAS